MRKKTKLVFGVGLNDTDYVIQPEGQPACSYYTKWIGTLKKCYSTSYQNNRSGYIGCTVCEEWLTFSNFKAWMETQPWGGKELSKNILIKGNKIYSPETCVFIPHKVITFTNDKLADRGDYLIGAYLDKRRDKFRASCRNPFTGKHESLGYHANEESAHEAWRIRKHELACQLADSEYVTDSRVVDALRSMYLPNWLASTPKPAETSENSAT